MSDWLVIRADASAETGTGHVMRMIALAEAWMARGGQAVLATSSECPPALQERVAARGIEVLISEGINGLRSLAKTRAASAVVVDGYDFKEPWQEALSDGTWRSLWMDDYGHCRTWNCDWVLNQNFHGESLRIEGRARLLGGPRFALLREDVMAGKPRQESCGPVRKILVSLGGGDAANVTGAVLGALEKAGTARLDVTVLAGAACPHLEQLRQQVANSRHACRLLSNVSSMAELYQDCDGVISAGGSTCYEWLYHGKPGFVLTTASNQRVIVEELDRRRLAWCAGEAGAWNGQGIEQWIETPLRAEYPPVDGLGAWRVAEVLKGQSKAIRSAVQGDLHFTFSLANEPSVRAAGFSTDPISMDEHSKWFSSRLGDSSSRIWIIEEPATGPVGVVRAHRREEGWEIGISLLPEARGRALARFGVQQGITFLMQEGESSFIARIRHGNSDSIQLFSRLGFVQGATSPECQTWQLQSEL